MKNSFRYNSKGGLGMNSEYLKTIVSKETWKGKLKMPVPQNKSEISLLSKFIFGVELSVDFENYYDEFYKATQDKYAEVSFLRFLKLYKLDSSPNKKDYIDKNNRSYSRNRNGKMVLSYFRYKCDTDHDTYYDSKFNYEVFNTSYELDSYFWRHCLGEISSGGISSRSYGHVETLFFKDYNRIDNIYKNVDEPASEIFKEELEKLILEDKKYDL